jgi:hypothetical protein
LHSTAPSPDSSPFLTLLPSLSPTGFNAEERSNFKNILIQNLLLGAKTLAAIAEENGSELLTDKKLTKVRAHSSPPHLFPASPRPFGELITHTHLVLFYLF